MESINTESPLKLLINLPGKSKKNNFVKFDTHAKKRKKKQKVQRNNEWEVENCKCVRRRGEKEEKGMDLDCGFTEFSKGACRGRPVGNWHWHID